MSESNVVILPVIAQAACSAVWNTKNYCCGGESKICRWREEYAVQIMDAIDAAGYEVVPKEPTQAMVHAALCHEHDGDLPSIYRDIYCVMLAAAKGDDECPTKA